MKKIGLIFIFIFLTGLFAGLFFSTSLSAEGNDSLSGLMTLAFSEKSPGFARVFTASLISNFTLVILMLPAVFSRLFSPLPAALLWYKSFAIGFCSGLLYINSPEDAFIISLVRFLPQNVFFIPAFIFIAALFFHISHSGGLKAVYPAGKKSRRGGSPPLLLYAAAGAALIVIGSVAEGIFSLISL
ncbi:MAG TPA: stage II sporulation protein M [Candidatus Copromorpha excrementigallinarum]|uniref:Stage II sporulation protein M n=1 Tax=Candidatus Allocopromorpha excrementigallinarum TaxID=2840742 RepID=A0A9D1L6G3_9FIRM|nr:stage II sporulation protein M [Candidatus Copromorpha excrementigallinarum]